MFDTSNAKKIRKICFNNKYLIDTELIRITGMEPSHEFLRNESFHNMHIYLVEYIKIFSESWFEHNNYKILDWGCGKGQVTYLCKKRNMETISCDIERESGDSAFFQKTPIIEHGKINVVPLKHPYLLPFEDNSFDVVVSFGVLEHVANDQESMKEINRILKLNGLFFCFFLPYQFGLKQIKHHLKGDFYHDHLYNFKIVRNLLDNSSMKLIDSWYRDILPKTKTPINYQKYENIDNWLCDNTILRHLAANIEFVACKK